MSIEVNATEQIISVNATGSTIDINVASQTVDVNATTSVIEVTASYNPGINLPNGGTTGQVLKKQSNTDYDTYWAADEKGVPYVGATGDVDLGEYEIKAGQFELDQSPTGTAGVAVTRWNDTIGSTETTLKGGSVVLKNGVDLIARVVNKVTPNTTLTKAAYQAVRISGAQGQRLAVALAQANNDNNSADTIGLVTETIATNQEGFIMTVGNLENINTTGSLQGETWTDGDVLYLSPTIAGVITNVKPVAPQHLVIIGYVEYAHANNGKIYVKTMNGYELGELHDVNTTGATNGQVLKYNGSIWTPQNDLNTGTVTSVDLSAPTGFVVTGNPITSSGTLALSFASGYSLPTTVKQGNWDDAYTFTSAFPSQTGNNGKYLTTDGSTLSWGTVSTANIYNSDGTLTGNRTLTQSTFSLTFAGSTSTRFHSTGNITIGGTTDAGYKLDVQGTGRIKATASSDAGQFVITDSASTSSLFRFTGNGKLFIGKGGFPSVIQVYGADNNLLGIYNYLDGATDNTGTFGAVNIGSIGNISNISVSKKYYNNLYLKSSITTSYNGAEVNESVIATVINGTSTGIMRGLYINPTITSGGTGWLAIQSTIGGAYFNTSSVVSSAILQADSSTQGFLPPRMTSTQRTAISTPAVGLVVYQTDATEGLYQYLSTGWSAVSGGGGTNIYNSDGTLTGNRTVTMGSYWVKFVGDIYVANTIRAGYGAGGQIYNTVFGSGALNSNTTGNFNVAIGASALASNLTGVINVAVGTSALQNSTGSANVALGGSSLINITSGSNNVAVGDNAGRYISGLVIALTNANTSIFIGRNTQALADSQTNQIVIGNGSVGLGSNTTVIGNSSTTDTAIYGRMLVNYSTPVIGTYALDVNGTARIAGTLRQTQGGNNYIDIVANANASSPYIDLFYSGTQAARLNSYATISGSSFVNQNGFLIGDTAGAGLTTYVRDLYAHRSIEIKGTTSGKLYFTSTGDNAISFFVPSVAYRGILGFASGTSYFQIRTNGATNFTDGTLSTIFDINGSVGIGGITSINASAILQADSSTKGFLPPRMTETQKNAISTPATGLVIYQTDGTEGLYERTSSAWRILYNTPSGGSGITRSVSNISTTQTAGAAASTDYVYLISGTTTLTLPTAVGNTNRYTLKNVGTNTVTINTTSSQTIDGSISITMAVQYTALDVISDGTNWNII